MQQRDPTFEELLAQGKDTIARLINHPFKTIGRWVLQSLLAIIAFALALSGGIVLTRTEPGAVLASIICFLIAVASGWAAIRI